MHTHVPRASWRSRPNGRNLLGVADFSWKINDHGVPNVTCRLKFKKCGPIVGTGSLELWGRVTRLLEVCNSFGQLYSNDLTVVLCVSPNKNKFHGRSNGGTVSLELWGGLLG